MNNDIVDAIENQNLIEIYYNDKIQIVKPYCYALSRTGNEILLGFQSFNKQNKLKQYNIDLAYDLNILKATFKKLETPIEIDNEKLVKIFAINKAI